MPNETNENRRRVFTVATLAEAEMMPEEEMPEGTPRMRPARMRMRIPLLPEGVFEHDWYGLLRWTPEVFAEMQANFTAGVLGFQPMLNYDHSSHNWAAAQKPAAGWIEGLEAVPGTGLDAVVSLTPNGRRCIEDEEYRYVSAEVADHWTTSTGANYANVIVGAALTNMPFHDTMRGLFAGAHQPARFSRAGRQFWVAGIDLAGQAPAGGRSDMSIMDAFRRFCGLAATNEEAQRAAREFEEQLQRELGQAKKEAEDAGSETIAASATPAPPAAPPGVPAPAGVIDHAAATGALEELRRQVADLTGRLDGETKARQDAQQALIQKGAQDAVARFMAQGKLTPAMREQALAFALADPEGFRKLYEAAPPLVNLADVGFAGGQGDADPAAETFESLVALAVQSGMDYLDAAREVSARRPELYKQYLRAGR